MEIFSHEIQSLEQATKLPAAKVTFREPTSLVDLDGHLASSQ
jgi:hypothetical protein